MPPDRLALPPEHLLDHDGVRAAHAAWREAATRHEKMRRDRIDAEQTQLPAAVERDKAADVEALEQGRKLPVKQANEQKVRDRIADLQRREQAADALRSKAHALLLETLDAEAPKLREQAAERKAAAEREFGEAVARVEEVAAKVAETRALVVWAQEPGSRAFKLRATSTPIRSQGGDSHTVDGLIGGLRGVIEPPPVPEPVPPQLIPANLLPENIAD